MEITENFIKNWKMIIYRIQAKVSSTVSLTSLPCGREERMQSILRACILQFFNTENNHRTFDTRYIGTMR